MEFRIGTGGRASPGFKVGEIHGGHIIGHFPAGGVLLRITNVIVGTETTEFQATALTDLAFGVGSQTTNQIIGMFTGWYIRGLQCQNAGNEAQARRISAFIPAADGTDLTAQFTTLAMPSNYVAGDVVELIPPQALAVSGEQYIQLAPGSLAAGGAGAAWRDAAFNRILQVFGICEVRILTRVGTAITAGGNVRLGTTNDTDAFLADQVAANASVMGTVGNIWVPGGVSKSEVPTDNGFPKWVVNSYDGAAGIQGTNNVGITWSSVPTAGVLVFDMWWRGLDSASYCVVGDGSAT